MKLDILTLREIWRARSGREKTLLTTLGALLGIALLYGLLWRPAATHRARLSAEIWALQSELAQMKQQEQEARRLARASSSATLSGEALTAALQASLAASGLDKAKILSVRDGARIQLSAAPFSMRALPWLLSALAASAVTVGAMLPAAWFTPAVARITHNRVHLTAPSGSVWRGSAMLMFSAGAHAVAPTVLPERIEWRTAFWPLLAGRIQLSLRADGAMPAPVALEIMRKTASLGAGRLSLPASIFTGLGAPFNTLGLKGEIQLEWKRWRIFGNRGFGQLVLHLNRMQSRVARIAPLGSYRIRIQAEGDHATLELSTVHGPLLLEGRGGWRAQGGFSFQGAARARAQERDNLRPLLTLLGPRIDDERYALRFTR